MVFGKKAKATRFDWKDKTTRPQLNQQNKKKKRFYKEEDDREEEEEDHLGITERHQRSEMAALFFKFNIFSTSNDNLEKT